jgi:hypothetical protein
MKTGELTMRFGMTVAALGAAVLAVPAQAAPHLYQYSVTATVTGTQSYYDPNFIFCNGEGPGSYMCYNTGPYSRSFIDVPATIVSEDGTGNFTFGYVHGAGEYSGTIIGGFVNGQPNFSGINFSFAYQLGNVSQYGTAATFRVNLLSVDGVPPIPEPATWGLLTLGFGGVGAALRRRQAKVSFA